MRVLLIDVNCKSSSTGQIVYNLYSYLNSRGDEAAVCYGRGEKIVERNIYKFGLDWETYLHAFLTRVTGFTGCFSYFSTRRLIRYIKKFKPDVVHIHELHAYFVNIKPLIMYLKSNHIKTVMTLHCEFAYTGKCGHSMECERWKTECNKCPRLRDYVSTLWFDCTRFMFRQKKELFKDFDNLSIVTPSIWLQKRVKDSFFKGRTTKLIYNGIDINVFRYYSDTKNIRTELNIADDEKVVLALAPNLMSSEKGGHFVEKLANMTVNKKVKFVFIGCEGESKRIEGNCIFLGPIYDKQLLAKYYSLADAFVICSKRENFPTTCLEAQCCGTPIFGFDTGGTKETSVSGFNLFSEYGDLCLLHTNMNKLLFNSVVDKVQISQEAMGLFANEVMCSKYHDLYSSFPSFIAK